MLLRWVGEVVGILAAARCVRQDVYITGMTAGGRILEVAPDSWGDQPEFPDVLQKVLLRFDDIGEREGFGDQRFDLLAFDVANRFRTRRPECTAEETEVSGWRSRSTRPSGGNGARGVRRQFSVSPATAAIRCSH